MTKTEEILGIRRNEQLLRRAKIRRILNTRSGPDGITSQEELADMLGVTRVTVDKDLKEIGAVKTPLTRIDGKNYSWWIVPSYNPLLPDLRTVLDDGTIENEVSLKMRANVVEVFLYGRQVFVKTERSAGPLVADWLSLLPWPEILHVSEERNAAIVHCVDVEAALYVKARLLGENDSVPNAD